MNKFLLLFVFVVLVTCAASGCGAEPSPPSSPAAPTAVASETPTSAPSETPTSAPAETVTAVPAEEGGQTMAFELTSSAFGAGEAIPRKYTCDGDDISPPLAWGDPPRARRVSRSSRMTPTRRWAPGCIGCFSTCQPAREQQLAAAGIRRPLPAQRHAPVFLQALRAGYDARSEGRREQG